MGSIINLNYDNGNDIYDGQQRILTTILILNVIGCLSPKLKGKINQLLTVDTEIDNLTKEQEQIKERCNVNIIPKIYCINPFDMEGLVNIFNNKIKSWVEYLSNIDDIVLYLRLVYFHTNFVLLKIVLYLRLNSPINSL